MEQRWREILSIPASRNGEGEFWIPMYVRISSTSKYTNTFWRNLGLWLQLQFKCRSTA